MKIVRICTILFILSMAGVAWAEMDVDYDHSVNHRLFKTYSWKEGVPIKDPIMEKQFHELIESQMEARGLKAAEGEADVYLATYTSMEVDRIVQGSDISYAPGWSGTVVTQADQFSLPVGTIRVDLIDGKTNQLCWRAVENNIIISQNPEKDSKKLEKLVKKMFKNYPPEAMEK